MTRELPRNLFAGAAVLALHVLVLLALAAALYHPVGTLEPVSQLVEVFVTLRQATRPPPPEPQLLSPRQPQATPFVEEPAIDNAPEAPPPAAALQGFGRALFGCGADKVATMTADERAHCPHMATGRPQEPSLRLGPYDPNSPFAQVVAKRNAPAVPITRPCPHDSPLFNTGMPCFDFSQKGAAIDSIEGQK